jgi:3-oxoacyl-[acyl-carrier protein] reductase
MKITGAKAFVTGGSGGLGAVIAKALAENGADVALSYSGNRDAAELVARNIQAMGRKACAVQMDQVQPNSINAAVEAVTTELGGLDILINNAAWNQAVPFADLDALTPELWDRMHHTNVRGPYLVTRSCAPHLKKNGNGRVVNISAFIGLSAEGSSIAHATAKAALIHLNRCLAVALAPDVTVNSVAPGLMDGTTMFNRIPVENTEAAKQRAALKRHTSLKDVADQVLTFCRAETVTGQVLVIDGGIVFH